VGAAVLTRSAAPAGQASAQQVLHEVFGYPAFRGQQGEVVAHVAGGGDALVLMPTGGGKSLCYQVPAILRHRGGLGVTVVVSPLIALMHDQVGALHEAGVSAAFLNSTLEGDEARRTERELMAGRLTLLYAAPERILTPRFMAMLASLHERGLLSLFAIDEAHCVSQWGHDFREEYLGLSALHEQFPGVPRLALTATADAHTRQDIIERLQLQAARLFVASFDRPNIRYTIVEKDDPKKQLLRFIRDEHDGEAGIVYCQSRRKVEDTAAWLQAEGIPALPYHAGLDAEVRRANQDRFLREESGSGTGDGGLVMVATIAFGMGIDKPDVRFVAHLDLPKNIEAYYQETGRAGRDGLPADAWMVYGLQDVVNQRRMIDESEAGEDFKRLQRGKLEALLALAEAHDCRRVRLLGYFGQAYREPDADPGSPVGGEPPRGVATAGSLGASSDADPGSPVGGEPPRGVATEGSLGARCGNCDNCLNAPATWDATEAARKALSGIYRFKQHHGQRFGAGHLIDVLRGKVTDKVKQYGHEALSTWGIGADVSEAQWRLVLRQMVALGHVQAEGEWGTLSLADSARSVLKGEVPVLLRMPSEAKPRLKAQRGRSTPGGTPGGAKLPPLPLDDAATERFLALKAWRAEVARSHNLPAYLVFHDATLAEMARSQPASLEALGGISGVGAKKLEAYGSEILRVLEAAS
jgi:ATP-dependent DNA helicase RecQ